MGGAALKIAKTRRYEKDEFFNLVPDVVSKLKPYFKDVHVTQAYFNKPSFGDMDVLVMSDGIDFVVRDFIQETFKPAEIYRNSHVYSFDYKELQIDIILVPESKWETSKQYFSYNDLGNFVGRVANRMGLKYGDYGLSFKHTHNGVGMGDVLISQDIPAIYEFLGFDYERYLKGFNELEEIFEYVVSSKHFTPQLFAVENLDHQNRTRNIKRKTYQLFLDYLEANKDKIKVDENFVLRKKGTNMTRHEFDNLLRADKFFGTNVVEQIATWTEGIKRKEKLKEKFNGNLVKERYGFEGKELGELMSGFKTSFRSEEVYEHFLEFNTQEFIFRRMDSYVSAKNSGTVGIKWVNANHETSAPAINLNKDEK